MRRIVVIVLTFVCGLTAVGTWLTSSWGAEAVESGRTLYPYRLLLEQIATWPPGDVVWLGDSTLLDRAYPDIIERRVGAAVPMRKLTSVGLDFWAMYQLLGDVMERLHPRVVVMVANLRLMRGGGTTRTFNDLAQSLPLDELPRTLLEPYSFRGMTAPRLLLARLLGSPWWEQTFFVAEGIRRNVQTAEAWQFLGPEEKRRTFDGAKANLARGAQRMAESYDQPLGYNTPLVRFCGAAVRYARTHGAQVLVVVSPIPTVHLAESGHYDPARTADRIDVLRTEVEAAGGRLLDLHAALPPELFRDHSGHFTPTGQDRMAGMVMPYLVTSLQAARQPEPPQNWK